MAQVNRNVLSKEMEAHIRTWYQKGSRELIAYIRSPKIRRKIQRRFGREDFTDSKRKLAKDLAWLSGVLAGYRYYDTADRLAAEKLVTDMTKVFEKSVGAGYRQVGIGQSQIDKFKLKNKALLRSVEKRAMTFPKSSQHNFQDVRRVLRRKFVEQGKNPFDRKFLNGIQQSLNIQHRWQAKRFALTETGVISNDAQNEAFTRLGIGMKQWAVAFGDKRHARLGMDGQTVGINQDFDVGGSPARYPLDPRLPPEQLINCHCALNPVTSGWQKGKVWLG